ncbi:uncharacterized protein LOC124942358 [Impatiens glandulifera]|uniref:uncharacterized protein LOC124942358 n=1 Tax=Impatiens glandulifera TaxID=253017 RepID=UPI001FB13A37|nr:uncharacterized protein LOC124942358 [Impatiens glandulifera]
MAVRETVEDLYGLSIRGFRTGYRFVLCVDASFLKHKEWFHNTREKADNHKVRLSQYYEKFLREQIEKTRLYNVNPLNRFEFYVHNGESHFKVNLHGMTCSCRLFDVSGLLCTHALVVARTRKLDPYDFCSRDMLSSLSSKRLDIPENIKQRVCLKPPVKVKKRRPTTNCRSSQDEPHKVQRRCSSCGGQGHNKATCKSVMPAPSTARASSQ